VQGSLLLLCAEIMLFLLTTLSLGIMISSVSNSQQTAMMISLMGLMLPTIILSGFIFPIENMPLPLRVVSSILPARWFNDIARGIMLKSMNFEMLWQQTAILFGMTCVYIAVGIKRFKLRLE
jgi:ABC-2 type transport system permease protein